ISRRDALKGLFSREDGRSKEAVREARELFLRDSDDAFRQAVVGYERAHGMDEASALALAGLAEAHATWAWYLREDARSLEAVGDRSAGDAAVRTLRSEAQAHIENAKRYASAALTLGPEQAAVNRAMADFLRVDGAPAAEVDRYVQRAQEL